MTVSSPTVKTIQNITAGITRYSSPVGDLDEADENDGFEKFWRLLIREPSNK